MTMPETTKQDVADLLENFKGYVNPKGELDPWFEIGEINQQFAWEDIPEATLKQWLDDLVAEGKVFTRMGTAQEWAWSAG